MKKIKKTKEVKAIKKVKGWAVFSIKKDILLGAYMEKAIKKAIEGGWIHKPALMMVDRYSVYHSVDYCLESIFDDPLFWQALGESLEWREEDYIRQPIFNGQPQWLFEWHNFIDHLAQGKDIDSFFEELLK